MSALFEEDFHAAPSCAARSAGRPPVLPPALAGGLVAAERSSASMARPRRRFWAACRPSSGRRRRSRSSRTSGRTGTSSRPTAFPRKGLTLKEMTEAQRERVRGLLKAGLSQRGYLTATPIMDSKPCSGRSSERDSGQRQRRRDHGARPRALLRLGLRDAVEPRPRGAGASKAITSRCSSRSSTARWSPTRRSSSGRTRPKCGRGRRRACGSSRSAKTRRARS